MDQLKIALALIVMLAFVIAIFIIIRFTLLRRYPNYFRPRFTLSPARRLTLVLIGLFFLGLAIFLLLSPGLSSFAVLCSTPLGILMGVSINSRSAP